MKLFKLLKDGGPLSKAHAFFLIEAKKLFSVAILRFDNGSRDAFHTHAFNAVSWVLRGKLVEHIPVVGYFTYTPSFRPIYTPRERMHRVISVGTTWVLTFRGPWVDCWKEFLPASGENLTLTHGRKVVERAPA